MSRGVRGHFSCKFPYKIALVKSPCAFQLCRLAQKWCRGISVWHFSCRFPHKMALATCSCLFRPRRLAQKQDISYRIRAYTEILLRDLMEILFGEKTSPSWNLQDFYAKTISRNPQQFYTRFHKDRVQKFTSSLYHSLQEAPQTVLKRTPGPLTGFRKTVKEGPCKTLYKSLRQEHPKRGFIRAPLYNT